MFIIEGFGGKECISPMGKSHFWDITLFVLWDSFIQSVLYQRFYLVIFDKHLLPKKTHDTGRTLCNSENLSFLSKDKKIMTEKTR